MSALTTTLALLLIPAFNAPLHNSFVKLTRDKKLKVVVVGNSVTAGAPENKAAQPGFYVKMEDWLTRTFPEAQITVVPKIIFAVGPEVQIFSLEDRVLAEEPDLVLAEFGAANAAWGEKGRAITEPATEGWIRRLREKDPACDVILMMGLLATMMPEYEAGRTPASAAFLHRVAAHYQALPVDAAAATAARIVAGEPWETFMKDFIHPSPGGYALYSETLVNRMAEEWNRFQSGPGTPAIEPHAPPDQTLHAKPWKDPKRIPATDSATTGFEKREFNGLAYLHAGNPDAHGSYRSPQGRHVVGVLMRENKPCGNLEVRSPDGSWIRLSQKQEPHFTVKEDPKNRLFRNFLAAYGLPNGMREVQFRISPDPEDPDGGNVEIAAFLETAE